MSENLKRNYTILRFPEVVKITGLSRATIYRKMNEGEFPQGVRVGERAIGWYADEINEFNSSRQRISSETNKVNRG